MTEFKPLEYPPIPPKFHKRARLTDEERRLMDEWLDFNIHELDWSDLKESERAIWWEEWRWDNQCWVYEQRLHKKGYEERPLELQFRRFVLEQLKLQRRMRLVGCFVVAFLIAYSTVLFLFVSR